MTPPVTYKFNVYFGPGSQVRWEFNGENDGPVCKVHIDDKIVFSFAPGPGSIGTVDECVLISGNEMQGETGSPFGPGKVINLRNPATLQVGGTKGNWGFSIAFSVKVTDGTTSFYFVPDPELQVGSIRD